MFQNITQSYDLTDATWEILIMLLVAFILGYLLHWLLNRRSQGEVVSASGAVSTHKNDDLKVVEGIGPKIEGLLKDAGIANWDDLAATEADRLKQILADAGDRFRFHDPSTWPDQADLARSGRWDELNDFQDTLNGGKTS